MEDKLNENEIKRCKYLLNEIDDFFYAIKLEINHSNYVSRRYLKEKVSKIITDMKCFDSILSDEQ